MKARRLAIAFGVAALAAQLAGCSPLYLLQASAGQLQLLRLRRPVADVVADPASSAELRRKLAVSAEALEFAHSVLLLPDNGAYRDYADLDRPFAVWNVFATPEFSLELRRWCFPVAGCVAYRGYFAETAARDYAADLARRGDDAYVGGVAAYSTLGYFADPLLSTLLQFPDEQLAGIIFHELAHQLIYVADDTAFNESFASFVEQEGLRRWLAARGDAQRACALQLVTARRAEVRRLLDGSRQRLTAIFAAALPEAGKRAAKSAEYARLDAEYRRLRATWTEPPYLDAWFGGPMNNATLGALAAYDERVPAFDEILRREAGLLLAFYARVRDLARLPAAARTAELAALDAAARRRSSAASPAVAGADRCATVARSPDLQ